MMESSAGDGGNEEESLADTEAEATDMAKDANEEESLADTEADRIEIEEGDSD